MSSIFPFLDGYVSDEHIEKDTDKLPMFKEIAWNFDKNEFITKDGSPMIIEGNEALKVWIYKALISKRYKYIIYSWDYGCEVENLMGKSNYSELIKNEIHRYVSEALLVNKYIRDISSTVINSIGDKLDLEITVKTVYGDLEVRLFV